MAGAYGNVGAVCYLTLFTFVTPSQFFMVIAAGAFVSFGLCLLWLKGRGRVLRRVLRVQRRP